MRRVRAQVQGFFAAMRLSWLSLWTFLLNSFAFSIGGTINNINVNQNRLQGSWPPISLNHGSNAENLLRCKMVPCGVWVPHRVLLWFSIAKSLFKKYPNFPQLCVVCGVCVCVCFLLLVDTGMLTRLQAFSQRD